MFILINKSNFSPLFVYFALTNQILVHILAYRLRPVVLPLLNFNVEMEYSEPSV